MLVSGANTSVACFSLTGAKTRKSKSESYDNCIRV